MTVCEDISFSIAPMLLVVYLCLGILFISLYVSKMLALPFIIIYIIYVVYLTGLFYKPNDFLKRNKALSESPIPAFF